MKIDRWLKSRPVHKEITLASETEPIPKPFQFRQNPRFTPKVLVPASVDWGGFRDWLSKDHAERNVGDLLRNARRYYNVLLDPTRASEMAGLSKSSRRRAMASLANLSKFLGIYDYWRGIMRNNGLKWEGRSTLDIVVNILNTDLSEVKTWLRKALKELPGEHGAILVFAALTGLRPREATMSCRLISETALFITSSTFFSIFISSEPF